MAIAQSLHDVIEESVRGKYFEFGGEYYLFGMLWAQEGERGTDSFQAEVYSKEGKYLRTQRVDSKRRRAFKLIPEKDLPWHAQTSASRKSRHYNVSYSEFVGRAFR
jgi:hypothetical protein